MLILAWRWKSPLEGKIGEPMIIIKDVDCYKFPGNIATIIDKYPHGEALVQDANQKVGVMDLQREILEGGRYVNDGGEEIVIALTSRVKRALGITLEGRASIRSRFKRFEDENDKLALLAEKYKQELSVIRGYGFWKRFCFVMGWL